jgi:hypothetical protein
MPRVLAYMFSDYKKISFTAIEQSYNIGQACIDANEPNAHLFVAEEIVLFSTQEVYVRFKAGGIQHRIPPNVYFEWYRATGTLWIQRISGDGDIEIWAEGYRKIS